MPPEVQPIPPQGGGATTRISSHGPVVAPPPPYGCLKNASKPTYRSWLRHTQKNKGNHLVNNPNIPDNAINQNTIPFLQN